MTITAPPTSQDPIADDDTRTEIAGLSTLLIEQAQLLATTTRRAVEIKQEIEARMGRYDDDCTYDTVWSALAWTAWSTPRCLSAISPLTSPTRFRPRSQRLHLPRSTCTERDPRPAPPQDG